MRSHCGSHLCGGRGGAASAGAAQVRLRSTRRGSGTLSLRRAHRGHSPGGLAEKRERAKSRSAATRRSSDDGSLYSAVRQTVPA